MQKPWKDSLEIRLQESGNGYEFQETASHYKAKLFVYCLSNLFQARRDLEQNRLKCFNPAQHDIETWGKRDSE